MGSKEATPEFATERRQILEAVDAEAAEAQALSHWMAAHPELSLEERATSARYVDYLEARGFRVTRAVAGMETAFTADRMGSKTAVRAALLAEMDALPGIGHACGHNLSGPASLLAAAALSKVLSPEVLGLRVVGCPAEETGVGKRRLVEFGTFADADVAMMAHASDMRRAHRLFLGNRKFDFIFHGRAAHAAAYPEEGINALDAVIQLFVAVGGLRQQLPRDVRIHGIITEGGMAPNIIPERAVARFWVRALETETLERAAQRVVECGQAAATATGSRLELVESPTSSPPMRVNLPLADCYRRQLDLLGLEETPHGPAQAIGSSDITHVARVVATIHPNFPIGKKLELHTREFSAATVTAEGQEGLLEGARALALTLHELARNPEVRAAVLTSSAESS